MLATSLLINIVVKIIVVKIVVFVVIIFVSISCNGSRTHKRDGADRVSMMLYNVIMSNVP